MTSAPEARFGISPLVKCECLVAPLKRGDPVLEQAYLEFFDRFLPLEMPESVYLRAAQLRARFGIRTPDALHLASAQHHGCESMWTNDDRLVRASHGLSVNILK
jgi:predicted nucleic acid-binding protein